MAHRHTTEFKQEAVRIALTSGLTRRQVASDYGIFDSWGMCRNGPLESLWNHAGAKNCVLGQMI